MNSRHDDNPRSTQTFPSSVRNALTGLLRALRSERNVRIDLVVGLLVVSAGFFLSIDTLEWVAVALSIGAVLSLEVMNAAVERVVDLASPEWSRSAGSAKDLAAGAVLAAAIAAACVGLVIFVPKVLSVITGPPGMSQDSLFGGLQG